MVGNITAAAGGAIEFNGIGISGGKGITAMGLKGDDFFFIGHAVSRKGLGPEVQRTWLESGIFTNGLGSEKINIAGVQISETFSYRSSIFLFESSTNSMTGKMINSLSLDIGTSIGFGLIAEIGLKWQFYGN